MIDGTVGIIVRARFVLLVVAAVLGLSGTARGEVLFQYQIPVDFRYDVIPVRPIVGPLVFDWAIFASPETPPAPRPPQPGRVFDTITFSSDTVGQTFRVLPGDDPDFATLEGYLTNGRQEYFWTTASFHDSTPITPGLGGSSGAGLERAYFQDRPAGDLAGYDITAFSVRHDRYDVQVSPSGQVINIMGAMTFTIEGAPLPEPGGLGLGLLGAACAMTLRRR